jgi:hypothetical protein
MYAAQTGDTARARQVLAAIAASHGATPPWIDAALPEARLWLSLGDTTKALDVLHGALDGVSRYEPRSLDEPIRAAVLVRAMALRSVLESAHGDKSSARAWSAAALELWRGADPLLQADARSLQMH